MRKSIKIGDTVETRQGIGIVVDRYKEIFGHYWLYEVAIGSKIWVTRNVWQ